MYTEINDVNKSRKIRKFYPYFIFKNLNNNFYITTLYYNQYCQSIYSISVTQELFCLLVLSLNNPFCKLKSIKH